MPKEPKHHYIPEFYLKQWAGPDGRLCEYTIRSHGVVPRMTHPGGTGYVRGLYTVKGAPENLKDVFETNLMSIADGQASVSLRHMIDVREVPSGIDKLPWTRFIMSLWYRTPEGVARSSEKIRKHYEEENLEEYRARYESERRPGDPATLEEYLKTNSSATVSRTTMVHLSDIILSQRVTEHIIKMQWACAHLRGGKHSLLTSDRPIVMYNGLAYPQSHIVMPISPQHIFVAANSDESAATLRRMAESGELATALNDRVVRQARKFAYAVDSKHLRFVANRLGQKITCSPFE
jgi:hypothetical protein